jgi:hypothetical protein
MDPIASSRLQDDERRGRLPPKKGDAGTESGMTV